MRNYESEAERQVGRDGETIKELLSELENLRSENAMLLRQRDPRHRSELDDVEIVQVAKEVEQTARANMAKMLHIE